MPLALNEEQRMLRDTARDFLQNDAPVNLMRQLRDDGNEQGYSDELWHKMIEMGWPAVAIPEQFGGLGFGFIGAGAILQEAGKTLANSPFFNTVALGAAAIIHGGNEAQQQTLLPKIAAGELTLALAHEESNHHQSRGIQCQANVDGEQLMINGSKQFVAEGANADLLIVSLRTAEPSDKKDGITLALIDPSTAGIKINRVNMIDSRNYAHIDFTNVIVSAGNVIGELDNSQTLLDKTLDHGRICLAAEMLGGAQAMLDKTVEYLKDREQFGRKIGAFQALQHRAAYMFAELEIAKSAVIHALSAIDENQDLALVASSAKTLANDCYRLITDEAVQMHGGIGLTDEMDIGFYLKRCRVSMQSLGDSGFHKNRFAKLNQF
ncbi:MAG: acyl-CoA dehydrogenase [Cellvibrionales bacterium]|nr:acyl-CoA dehydrogenase [Cellvibrionales bacterium]HCH21180.1 acyl-CoA dehydrogenase [Cellvibrionales bacterium]